MKPILLSQENPSMTEQELVFDAVKATMNQLKGSYSIISLISQARFPLSRRFPATESGFATPLPEDATPLPACTTEYQQN